MKYLLLILLLAASCNSQPDWYPPEDHQPYWHVGLSTASQLTAYTILRKHLYLRRDRALFWSIPLGMVPGVLKEVIDKRKNNYFNMEDLGYDTMGVTLGVSFVLAYKLHF